MKRTDIDALARMLDGDTAPAAASEDTRALAALAVALESSAAPQRTRASAYESGAPHAVATLPRPEFRAELRASLITAAREQTANPPLLTRLRQRVDDTTTRWRYSTRVAAATGATALALSTGGVAVAAQQALPNEPLYGVKLTLEDARLLLILDPVARAEQRLAFATDRIDDAAIVAAQGDFAAAARALEEADATARTAAGELLAVARERQDPTVLDELDEWTEHQRDVLDELTPLFGGEASVAVSDVIVALSRISSRITLLSGCETCAGLDILDVIPAADQPFAACPCTEPGSNVASPAKGDGNGTSTKPRKRTQDGEAKPAETTVTAGDDTSGDGTSDGTGTTTTTDDDGTTGDDGETPTVSLPGPNTGTGTNTDDNPTDDNPTNDDPTDDPAVGDDVGDTVDDVIEDVTNPQPTPGSSTKLPLQPNDGTSDLGL